MIEPDADAFRLTLGKWVALGASRLCKFARITEIHGAVAGKEPVGLTQSHEDTKKRLGIFASWLGVFVRDQQDG